MPLDYLRSAIDCRPLPVHVDDEHGLQCIRVLLAAGLIEATVTPADIPGVDRSAEVHAITTQGRVALARYVQGKPLL